MSQKVDSRIQFFPKLMFYVVFVCVVVTRVSYPMMHLYRRTRGFSSFPLEGLNGKDAQPSPQYRLHGRTGPEDYVTTPSERGNNNGNSWSVMPRNVNGMLPFVREIIQVLIFIYHWLFPPTSQSVACGRVDHCQFQVNHLLSPLRFNQNLKQQSFFQLVMLTLDRKILIYSKIVLILLPEGNNLIVLCAGNFALNLKNSQMEQIYYLRTSQKRVIFLQGAKAVRREQ